MKKSFSIFELVFVLTLLAFLYTVFIPTKNDNSLNEVTNRLVLYLKYLRYKAMINDKFNSEDTLWFKKRWTLKFFRCRESVGGLYYVIYSDKNNSGHPSSNDSLKDPLTNKNIYSSNYCKEKNENSKYVLLTKNYDISEIKISCNNTSSLGQISFSNKGRVFTKLSNLENESDKYILDETCFIDLLTSKNQKRTIKIHNKTSFIELIENKN